LLDQGDELVDGRRREDCSSRIRSAPNAGDTDGVISFPPDRRSTCAWLMSTRRPRRWRSRTCRGCASTLP